MYCMRKGNQSKQSFIFQSNQIEANAPTSARFIPRKMGKLKHWLNRNRRRNDQVFIFSWLVVAHLLLLPIVKVSHADGVEQATAIAGVPRQLVAAAQLQLADCWVVTLISCLSPPRPLVMLFCAIPGEKDWEGGRETPGSDPLDPITTPRFLDF